ASATGLRPLEAQECGERVAEVQFTVGTGGETERRARAHGSRITRAGALAKCRHARHRTPRGGRVGHAHRPREVVSTAARRPRAVAARYLLKDRIIATPLDRGIEHRPAVDQPTAAGEDNSLVHTIARAGEHEPVTGGLAQRKAAALDAIGNQILCARMK